MGKTHDDYSGSPKTGRSLDEICSQAQGTPGDRGYGKGRCDNAARATSNRIKDELVKMGFAEDHIEIY